VDASPNALVERLRAALEGRVEVRVAILYGSRARGQARDDSDVDLALLAPGVDREELSARLSLALGLEVQIVELDQATIPLLRQIVDQGILVHEGRPGAAACWRSHTLVDLETDGPWYARMRDGWLIRVAERGL
jgi:predicted nucleotidyltransferase